MFAVIMTGGSGTRFWPVSRRQRPKQFLNITGKEPLVVETCNRLAPLARDEEMILVLGREHLDQARELFKGRPVHLLAEPAGRNTAPCMGLGALYAAHLGCTGPVAFLPADHFIGDRRAFVQALQAAGELASEGGIVTLGIVPNRPETGYGYIRRVAEDHRLVGDFKAYRVSRFVEKPDYDRACRYLSTGEYFWNAGIFVATPGTLLGAVRTHLPELYSGLMRLKEAFSRDRFDSELEGVYQEIEAVSFDYGVMEKTTEEVFVLPCHCAWSDVGSWRSLYELRQKDCDAHGNLVEGETTLVGCRESFVSAKGGRLVACLGLKDCLIVDTPDALLVADLDLSQDIRKIVEVLKKRRKKELL